MRRSSNYKGKELDVSFPEPKGDLYGGQHALIQRCAYLKDNSEIKFKIAHPFLTSKFRRAVIDAGLEDYLESSNCKISSPHYKLGLLKLAFYLIRRRPFIIHADGFDSCYLACLLKMVGIIKSKIVFTLRSDRYHRFNFFDYLFIKRVDKLITNSSYSRGEILKRVGGDVLVHYSPIDLKSISERVRGLDETKNRLEGSGRVISYVGALEPRKNLGFFIKVAEILIKNGCQYKFHIYGTAKNKASIDYLQGVTKGLSDQAKKYIVFKGYSPIEQAIHETDILLCPFTNEPLGRVVSEFLCAGRAVVVSDSGGLQEAGMGYASVYRSDSVDDCLDKILTSRAFEGREVVDKLSQRFSPESAALQDLLVYRAFLDEEARK